MVIARRRVLTICLLAIGIGLILYYGNRTRKSYHQFRYTKQQGLDTGDANVDAIRPWMTIHFVAAAYAVPQEYLFAELGVELEDRRRNIDIRHLNEELELGQSSLGRYPAVIDQLRKTILAYRENPVVTGLVDVRGWMTLQYVANSSGVSATTIIDELGLADLAQQATHGPDENGDGEVNVHLPFDELAGRLRFPGGPHRLCEEIATVLRRQSEDAP
ncbi:hypothetical protein CA13_01810 [Planctomycetes bacterium CA13]|uniref:Uncharacterized protein n=1 Tax=Novipirellula herctigrandis TaxID=2527986 RepID=A0A5C5YUU5_9BACT|nr:hypothetical protein CA13_01810 [Planctomycetes bacterium CA13]